MSTCKRQEPDSYRCMSFGRLARKIGARTTGSARLPFYLPGGRTSHRSRETKYQPTVLLFKYVHHICNDVYLPYSIFQPDLRHLLGFPNHHISLNDTSAHSTSSLQSEPPTCLHWQVIFPYRTKAPHESLWQTQS